MKNLGSNLARLTATAWVGAQWGVGYLAVPVLFQTLPDKMLAGMLAGKMFSLIDYLGLACGMYLLGYLYAKSGTAALRQPLFLVIAAMLLLTLVSKFGLQPVMESLKARVYPADITHSPYAGKFGLLHHIATACYVVQSLLGIALVLRLTRPDPVISPP